MFEGKSPVELNFTVGQRSVAGIKADNEDAIGIRIPKGNLLNTKGAVAVIADGVSAAEAGKEASETCVYSFLSDYYSTPDTWSVKKSSAKVLTALNRWLFGQGRHFTDAQKGFVSTFSCIVFKSHTAYIFHIGDTRIYRLRDGDLEQLTRDHATFISDTQTYLSRAMGLDVTLDVDYRAIDVALGDVFFLSTDGVHDFVKPADIKASLRAVATQKSDEDYEQCCRALIEQALERDSNDNLSCQILRVDSLPSQSIGDVSHKLTALPFPPELKPGIVLDGYRIEKQLHRNQHSQFFRVTEVNSGQRYCLKTPSSNYENDTAYIERFVMESWIGTRINNPHVLKVVESNKQKSSLYYVTEYVDGMTLAQWIRENPKPAVQSVIYLIEQLVKGLRAMHRRETLHQDITPENIMIDTNGEIKIIDFGSCYVSGVAEMSRSMDFDSHRLADGYSAPEVILEGNNSIQSEIFSVAAIAFEMLTGKEAFNGQLRTCRSAKDYLKTKYTPCFDINPLVPIWIDGAVKKGLRYDRGRRYEDVSEFLYQLRHPNPKYKKHYKTALLEKNPLRFWQGVSAVLFVALCVSSYFGQR